MRIRLAAAVAFAALLSGTGRAADYLYTFSGVISFAENSDATDIYANAGDPITFSLRVRDDLPTVAYSYGATTSSAVGGPDYAPGTLFPVDRTVLIDPARGYANDFTPLEVGVVPGDDYSATLSKDLTAKTLSLGMHFSDYTPSDPSCTDHCGGSTVSHDATVQVASASFASADFRELGSFALDPGSTATLADSSAAYMSAGDVYTVDLSRLTVALVPGAVPEPGTWATMLVGFALAGASSRRRAHRSRPVAR